MTTNNKAATEANRAASDTASNGVKSSTQKDPVMGWYGLAADAKSRQQKAPNQPWKQREFIAFFHGKTCKTISKHKKATAMRIDTGLFNARHKAHERLRYHEQRAHWFRQAWYCLVIGLLRRVARVVRK